MEARQVYFLLVDMALKIEESNQEAQVIYDKMHR